MSSWLLQESGPEPVSKNLSNAIPRLARIKKKNNIGIELPILPKLWGKLLQQPVSKSAIVFEMKEGVS